MDSQAFYGNLKKNPFNLHHHDVKSLSFNVNGINYPKAGPLEFYFDDDNKTDKFSIGLDQVFKNWDMDGKNEGNLITRESFPKGYFVACIKLAPGPDAPLQHGYCRFFFLKSFEDEIILFSLFFSFSIVFHKVLAKSTICCLIAEFPSQIEITDERQIHTDYTAI